MKKLAILPAILFFSTLSPFVSLSLLFPFYLLSSIFSRLIFTFPCLAYLIESDSKTFLMAVTNNFGLQNTMSVQLLEREKGEGRKGRKMEKARERERERGRTYVNFWKVIGSGATPRACMRDPQYG
jgi:hypothetical protein